MEPGLIGFNMGDVEVIEKLPEQVLYCYLLPLRNKLGSVLDGLRYLVENGTLKMNFLTLV